VIQAVNLRKTAPDLALDFQVAGAFNREVEETIQSGLPRTLSFRLELYRPRLLIPDHRLRAWQIEHTIRYDNLKDEFSIMRTVTVDGEDAPRKLPTIVRRGLRQAAATVTKVEGFPIPIAQSDPPTDYLLRIRARVEPIREGASAWIGRLPVPPIPPFGQRKSEWYVQEFEF